MLTVITPVTRAGAALGGMRRAWPELQTALGSDSAALGNVIFYTPYTRRPYVRLRDDDGRLLTLPVRADRPREFHQALVRAADAWIDRKIGTQVGFWLLNRPIVRQNPKPERMFVEFATAYSPLAVQCMTGDLTACRQALGLEPSMDPVHEWYDEESRRGLVQDMEGVVARDREAAEVCIERGWDQICVAILERVRDDGALPRPVGPDVRADLLLTALARGGEGALTRLLSLGNVTGDTIDIADALSVVAREPFDTLLARWQSAFANAPPPQVTFEPRGAVVTIVWILGLVALSLRNTRWR